MTFTFHPEAETEFNAAIKYYEEIEPSLGYDFALEVRATVNRAILSPRAWSIIDGEIRRSLVNRFPYGVLYSVEHEKIYIVAVMNLHRHPDYWKHRK